MLFCKKGKLTTRIKCENSLNLSIFEQKFLLGLKELWDRWVTGSYACAHVTPIIVWVVSKNKSNCLLENKMMCMLIWRSVRLHVIDLILLSPKPFSSQKNNSCTRMFMRAYVKSYQKCRPLIGVYILPNMATKYSNMSDPYQTTITCLCLICQSVKDK